MQALKFAVHFVGDIHQPLHTVKELGGANGFEVGIYMEGVTCKQDKYRYKCSPLAATDLHTLWDSTLIQRQYWSWGKYVDDLEKGWLTSEDAQGVDGGTPQEWAVESHAKAQEIWEMTPEPAAAMSAAIKNTVLTDEYLGKAIAIINRQLGLAGLRLARPLKRSLRLLPRSVTRAFLHFGVDLSEGHLRLGVFATTATA